MKPDPCPFCGFNDTKPIAGAKGRFYVECGKCMARGPSTIVGTAKAIQKWNERKMK